MVKKFELKTWHLIVLVLVLFAMVAYWPAGRHSLTDAQCAVKHAATCNGNIRTVWVGSGSTYSECSVFTQDCGFSGKICQSGVCVAPSSNTGGTSQPISPLTVGLAIFGIAVLLMIIMKMSKGNQY